MPSCIRELDELRKQIGGLERWILPLPQRPSTSSRRVLARPPISRACCSRRITPCRRYQMPAKVTDAMAMAVPCLVTPVPPLRPLIDKDVVEVFDGDVPLDERLRDIFADPDERARPRSAGPRRVPRVVQLRGGAPGRRGGDRATLDDPPPPPARLLDTRSRRCSPADVAAASGPSLGAGAPIAAACRPASTYDLVVFWKQNDTGIYGRRQDMFLKYLARSGRFATIVHFDHPMSAEGLCRTDSQAACAARPEPSRRPADAAPRAAPAGPGAVRHRTFL